MSHRARSAAKAAASRATEADESTRPIPHSGESSSLESLSKLNKRKKSKEKNSSKVEGVKKHKKRSSSSGNGESSDMGGKRRHSDVNGRQTLEETEQPEDNKSDRSQHSAEETNGVSRNPEAVISGNKPTPSKDASAAGKVDRSSVLESILGDDTDTDPTYSFDRIQNLLHRENKNLVTLATGLQESSRFSLYSVLVQCLNLLLDERITVEYGLDVADNLFEVMCASSVLGRQVLSDENVTAACNALQLVLGMLLGRSATEDVSTPFGSKLIVEKTEKLLHHVSRLGCVLRLPNEHALRLIDSLAELTLIGIRSSETSLAESSIRLRKAGLECVVSLCSERRELRQELATTVISSLPKIAENRYVRCFKLPRGFTVDAGSDSPLQRQSIGFVAALLLNLTEDICSQELMRVWESGGNVSQTSFNLSFATAVFSTLFEYCNTGYLSVDWHSLLYQIVVDILACLGLPEWPSAFHIQWMVTSKLVNTLSELEGKKSLNTNERKLGTTAISLLGDSIKSVLTLRRICCQHVAVIQLDNNSIRMQEPVSHSGEEVVPVSLKEWVDPEGTVEQSVASQNERPVWIDHQQIEEIISLSDSAEACNVYAANFASELSESAKKRSSLCGTKKNLSSLFSLSKDDESSNQGDGELDDSDVKQNIDRSECPLWIQRVVLREVLHSQMAEAVHENAMRDAARRFCLAMWSTASEPKLTDAELYQYMRNAPLPKLVWTDRRASLRLSREKLISLFVQSCVGLPMLGNLNVLINALLHQASSAVSKWRQKVVDCLKSLVEMDEHIADVGAIKSVIETRFMDQSISVRSAVIDLIGNHVEGRMHLVTKFIRPLVNKLDDTGLSVRKQATKILQRLLRANYGLGRGSAVGDLTYEQVSSIFTAFVYRVADPNEEPTVRDLILETCFEIWFSVPTFSAGSPSRNESSTCATDLILRRIMHLLIVSHQFCSLKQAAANHCEDGFLEMNKFSNFMASLLSRDKQSQKPSTDYQAVGRSFGNAFKEQLQDNSDGITITSTDERLTGNIPTLKTTGDVIIGLFECSIRILLTWRHDNSLAGISDKMQIPSNRVPACVMLVISELAKCVPSYCLKRLDIFKLVLDDTMEALKQGTVGEAEMLSILLCCNTVQNAFSHVEVANSQQLMDFARILCSLLTESALGLSTSKEIVGCLDSICTLLHRTTSDEASKKITSLINSKFYALQKLLVFLYKDTTRQVEAVSEQYESQPLLQKQAAMRGWLAWMHSGNGRNQGKMLQDACFALRTCGVLAQFSNYFQLSVPFEMDGVDINEESVGNCPAAAINLVKLYIAWLHWMTNADFLRPKSPDESIPALHYTSQRLIEACLDGLIQVSVQYPQFLLADIVQRLLTWVLRHQTGELRSVLIESFNMLLNTPPGRSDSVNRPSIDVHNGDVDMPMDENVADLESSDAVDTVDPTATTITGALQAQMSDIRRQFFHIGQGYLRLRLSTLQLWSNLVSQRIIDPDEGCIPLVALLTDWNAQVRQAAWKSIATIHERHNSTLSRCSTKAIAAGYSYQCKLYGGACATPLASKNEQEVSRLTASCASFFHNFYKKTILEGGDNKSHTKEAVALIRGLVSKFRCPVYISGQNEDDAQGMSDSDSEVEDEGIDGEEDDEDAVPAGLDIRRGPSGGALNEDCCPFQEGIRSLSNVNVSHRRKADEEDDVAGRTYTHDAMLIENANGVLKGSKVRGEIADIGFLRFLAETLFCLPFGKRSEVYSLCHSASSIISVQGDQAREELMSMYTNGRITADEMNMPQVRANCIQLLAVVYLQILTLALGERYSVSEQQLASFNPKKSKENNDGDKKLIDRYPDMEVSFPQVPSLLERQHGWLRCREQGSERNVDSLQTLVNNVIDLFDGLQGDDSTEFLKDKRIVLFGNAVKRIPSTPSSNPRVGSSSKQDVGSAVSNGNQKRARTSSSSKSSKKRNPVKAARSKKTKGYEDEESSDAQSETEDGEEAYVPRKSSMRKENRRA